MANGGAGGRGEARRPVFRFPGGAAVSQLPLSQFTSSHKKHSALGKLLTVCFSSGLALLPFPLPAHHCWCTQGLQCAVQEVRVCRTDKKRAMAASRVQVSFWAGHRVLFPAPTPERPMLAQFPHPQPCAWRVLTCPVSFGTCGSWRRTIAGVASEGCSARMKSWCWSF